MKIIALEEHALDIPIGSATSKVCTDNYPYYYEFTHPTNYFSKVANPFELGEKRIQEMDKNGIDIEVLSYTNTTQWLSGEEALTLSKAANDSLAKAVKEYPTRFRAFATLPWSDPVLASQELRRTIEEYGFVDTLISGRPQTGNVFLDDKVYYPIWEVLTEFDLPIYIHPGLTSPDVINAYYDGYDKQMNMMLSTFGFGWHLEAGIQVIRMILSGVFVKFPKLKVISGHWGELVPYYLSRFDHMFPPSMTGLPENFSFYYKQNVWVTPSGIYDNEDFELCTKKLGIDHIVFSADYPYISEEGARSFVENLPASEEDKEKFGSKNAEKLLHLT